MRQAVVHEAMLHHALVILVLCIPVQILYASFAYGQQASNDFSSKQPTERSSQHQVPESFTVEHLIRPGKLSTPAAIAFAADGWVIVGEKEGKVYAWRRGIRDLQLVLDVSDEVYNNGARGLASIAVDTTSGHLFMLYSVSDVNDEEEGGAFGRITRYTLGSSPPTVLSESRRVLLGDVYAAGIPQCSPFSSPGVLRLGGDGALLVATGDGADPVRADAGGLHASCFGGDRFNIEEDIGAFRAQAGTSLAGKLLRLDPETGFGVASNPMYNGDGSDPVSKIWAYGLREPVGIVPLLEEGQPGTLLIADRGGSVVEEANVVTQGGQQFGWPCIDGFVAADGYSEHPLATTYCEDTDTAITPSQFWHHQNPSFSNPPGLGGNALVGGARYRGRAYPSFYQNRLFYADLSRGWMATTSVDANGQPLEQVVFSQAIGIIADIQYNAYDEGIYFIDAGERNIARLTHQDETTVVRLPPVSADAAVGNGLYSTYYERADFSGDQVFRVDPLLDFDAFQAPNGMWQAVQWDGSIVPAFSETYTLYLSSEEESRLWVNDSLVVDQWEDAFPEVSGGRTGTVFMEFEAERPYRIRIAHRRQGGTLQAGLEWSSRSQPREVVPEDRLFYPVGEQVNLCRAPGVRISRSSSVSAFADGFNACDGNTDGDFFEGSVFVSDVEMQPYWEVDLGIERDVDTITLWNRTDCCSETLAGAFVIVSSSSFQSSDLSVLGQGGVSAYLVSDAPSPSADISVRRKARYVRIQLPREASLHLAEVEVKAGLGVETGAPPVEGLVSWWSFENGAADRRGTNDANLRNGATVRLDDEDASGKRRNVLDLDGRNDVAEVPHADVLNGTTGLTYAAWVYPEDVDEQATLLTKSSQGDGQLHLEIVGELSGNRPPDDLKLIARAVTTSGTHEVSAPFSFANEWVHVALVYAGNALQLYVNAVLVEELRVEYGSLLLNQTPFQMGGSGDGPDNEFGGRLDDVVVYGRALDSADINQLASVSSNVSTEDAVFKDPSRLPAKLFVESVFPNPFAHSMTLRYSVEETVNVEVAVFDALGRRIRGFRPGIKPAGDYAIHWDGTDDSGQQVSGGVYFVRIEALQHTHTTTVVKF